MPHHAEEEVKVFAGIDVSARELSVALLRSKESEETAATFTNTRPGHKALLAYLLRGNQRVRVCLEVTGNYSLDLVLCPTDFFAAPNMTSGVPSSSCGVEL
jgi:hypothetical protein